MVIFNYSKDILEKSEMIVLGKKYKISLIKDYQEDIIFPAGFMQLGFQNFFIPLLKSIKYIAYLFITLVIYQIFVGTTINNFLIVAFGFLSLLFFALPSTYSFYNIQDSHINEILKLLKKYIKTNEGLELVEDNLDKAYKRVMLRITTLRWSAKMVWIIYVFLSKKFIDILDSSNLDKFIVTTESLLEIVGPLLCLIILISVYKRGIDILFKTIEFAINEYKQILRNCDNHNKKNYFNKHKKF